MKNCGPHIEEFLVKDKESRRRVQQEKKNISAEESKEKKKSSVDMEDLERKVIDVIKDLGRNDKRRFVKLKDMLGSIRE